MSKLSFCVRERAVLQTFTHKATRKVIINIDVLKGRTAHNSSLNHPLQYKVY